MSLGGGARAGSRGEPDERDRRRGRTPRVAEQDRRRGRGGPRGTRRQATAAADAGRDMAAGRPAAVPGVHVLQGIHRHDLRHGVGQPARGRQPGHLERQPRSASSRAAEHDLRHDPGADRGRDRLAAHGTRGAGRLDCLVAGRVVVRRGTRDGADRRGEPGQRRARRRDPLRAARGVAVAFRPPGSGYCPVHGGARGRCPGGAGAVARAVAQPGLLRAAAGEPGAAGAARHDRRDDGRRAGLAGRAGPRGRLTRRPPGAGRLDRAGHRPGDRRRGRIPADPGRPGDPGAGHRGGRGVLGVRPGARGDHDRRGHRPQLRAAARPAGPRLLAGPGRGHRAPRPAPAAAGHEGTAGS